MQSLKFNAIYLFDFKGVNIFGNSLKSQLCLEIKLQRKLSILTMNSDKDTEWLLREGLDRADVPPLVHQVHILDDQHPVVILLVQDGVPGVPTEGHVPHCEEVQGGLPGHCPGDQGCLEIRNGYNIYVWNTVNKIKESMSQEKYNLVWQYGK